MIVTVNSLKKENFMKQVLMLPFIAFNLTLASYAQAFTLKTNGGDVKFVAVGKPGFLKIKGTSNGSYAKGNLQLSSDSLAGDFEFDLNVLDTGIGLRNEHMKEKYLEVKKFPSAKLSLKPLSLTKKDIANKIEKEFAGTLSLHGVEKPITGKFTYAPQEKLAVARFTINVSDYKIDVPKYLGVTVSETVDIEVNSKFEVID